MALIVDCDETGVKSLIHDLLFQITGRWTTIAKGEFTKTPIKRGILSILDFVLSGT